MVVYLDDEQAKVAADARHRAWCLGPSLRKG